ncbi:MAG: tRNA epoxyqueuosine(34) reductase QueG [Cellvibrionales bacterium]|nr:tRNA epoxyqueuosine(34) reductase QueG [Cellvibrionales bacterium]
MQQDHLNQLANHIQGWAQDSGFQQVGITDCDLSHYRPYVEQWLDAHYQGEMGYMQRNLDKRLDPSKLLEGTLRVISFRMDYLPENEKQRMPEVLASTNKAYISRYALGRDYHKLMRKRLAKIAGQIEDFSEQHLTQRAFVDSAPVLERALAEKAGLGWIGKNTMLINKKAGSYFFLGEILTDIPLPLTEHQDPALHCGSCTACLTACPTNAFTSAHKLDAKKCISYLTIEFKGSIPNDLRKKIGNRVYGCDDCQIVCPWNKFNQRTQERDFYARNNLDKEALLTLFLWSEAEFLSRTEGSPIRRIGYQQWLRNLAVGLGNADTSKEIINALTQRLSEIALSDIAREHIEWALKEQLKAPQ